ncbi:hypothetical protein LCGC14_0575810 [marine sediment metagenome]|uniref:Uncharacterized protein n=1 Tax=marine sediment metagenome TaxID=412755 RepID=A0A0F9UR75_9ZZZZ
MALWSRVFSGNNVSTTQGGGCCTITTAACNRTSPNEGTVKPTVFDDLPVQTNSVADAIGYWAEQLRRRLAAMATITATSLQVYVITYRRGARTDVVTWQMETQQGALPLVVQYTGPVDSAANQQFQNMRHAVDWLVDKLA